MINSRPLEKGESPEFAASDFSVSMRPIYETLSNDELIEVYDKLSLHEKLIRLMNFGVA